MLDINKTLDLVKLKFFNEWLYTSHLYDEGESELHKKVTSEVYNSYFAPLNIKKDANILDIGCGYGYFLDLAKANGYTNLTGITLSESNAKSARERGHKIEEFDSTFIPQKDGYIDESVDFIFLRHTLHHSPYPIFSLVEYNRLLKQGGQIYIEVPAPNCDRRHEFNSNIYSILEKTQLMALLMRTGFKLDTFNEIEFTLTSETENGEKTDLEHYYCIVATKQNPLDIK